MTGGVSEEFHLLLTSGRKRNVEQVDRLRE